MRIPSLFMVSSVMMLAACASPSGRDVPPVPVVPAGALETFVEGLPGRFGSASRLDQPDQSVIFDLDVRPYSDAAVMLEFTEYREERQRGFLLVLGRDSGKPFINGQFTPLQPDGRPAARSCAMRFRLLEGLLSGETDPQTCRFGADANPIGLLKEVALSRDQIVIADLLSRPGQAPEGEPDVLRLYRLGAFRGTARARSGTGRSWRVAESIGIRVGNQVVEPLDAAGMSLDVLIRLALVQGQLPGQPLLYLQISDAITEEVLGQAWANAQARRIGLALDDVQVDLTRQ